jgi:Fe2+ transport system protein FeoA
LWERRDLDAFRQTLRDLGHVEGDNITIEHNARIRGLIH